MEEDLEACPICNGTGSVQYEENNQQDLAFDLASRLGDRFEINCMINMNRTPVYAYELECYIRGFLEEMGCVIVKVGKSPASDIDPGDLPF